MRSFLPLLFVLCSCATPLPRVDKGSAGVGYGAGVASAKLAKEVKDFFTPEYKLKKYPSKICERIKASPSPKPLIKCVITPCVFDLTPDQLIDKHCATVEDEDSFWDREVVVESLDTSAIKHSAIFNFCLKNKDVCVNMIGRFKDKTILLTEE